MSGAGRSTAVDVLEDLGFFCIDNLPPAIMPRVIELALEGKEISRVGFGIDVRTGAFLEGAKEQLDELRRSGHHDEVLFLDASDEVLIRRFSETRRPHPLAHAGDVASGIQRERERMASLKARAKWVIDTSGLNVHALRRILVEHLTQEGESPIMVTRFVSFGFKYGVPVDADLVFDVRYMPNPHFVPELKPHTGTDAGVRDYVLGSPEAAEFLADVEPLLRHTLPRYEKEGKAYLTIAVGCTGGRHRSVAIAEELGRRFAEGDRKVSVVHRDMRREERGSTVTG